ncbi:FecR family protein [Janthinobacterium sp. DSP2-3-3]|uniref:FecR family protein n=1 Tax=Janthinobacterium sp. DSP2-3-3 TaxID=2804596 RepID=UPI003CF86701
MKTPPPKNSHATSPSDLDAQAWNWLRLLTSGDAREVDAQQFRRWVKSSPSHQAAYNDVKRRWDAIEAPARELLRVKPEAATLGACRPRLVPGGRRAFLGAAISAAAVAGVAVVHPPLGLWPGPDEWNADDRTATGERRTLALSGGVDVMLNTRTSIRRQTDGGKLVGLDLLIGEASIDVRDGGQAFAVVAGVGRSLLESGRVEVRHLNGKVCVTCIEGTVRVQHPAGARQLYARQQMMYGASSVGDIASIDPKAVSAWRQGMLVFNQVPLADVLDEINRYRSGRVVLMNDAVRNKPVSGRFSTASLDLALWQLQESFQLHARSLPAGLLFLS